MTIKSRIKILEKHHKNTNDKITVELIGDDPDDPNFLIIDPYGPAPRRISKADHEAEIEALRTAGEEVIIVDGKGDEYNQA